jgi:hypothetical protein
MKISRFFGWHRRHAAATEKSAYIISQPWLGALLVAVFTSLAHGQIPMSTPQSSVPKSDAVASAVDQRTQFEIQLREARRRQEAGHLEEGGTPAAEGLPIERSPASPRPPRAGLQRTPQAARRTGEPQKNRAAGQGLRKQALLAEFSRLPHPTPPCSVDALRDECGCPRKRSASAVWRRRSGHWKRSKSDGSTTQRRAAEAVRLAEDKLGPRRRAPDAVDKERLSRELASLRRQLAEAELANLEYWTRQGPSWR